MILTLTTSLVGIAFLLTIVHAISPRVPIWIPVLLLCVALIAR